MIRFFFASIAAIALLTLIGCSTGPAPQPVTEGPLATGEETATKASESAHEKRAEDDRIIYASSRNTDAVASEPETDDNDDTDDHSAPRDLTVATVHLDDQGRFLTPDGSVVDVQQLSKLTDDPLEGRGIRLVVDPGATELAIDALMPLFESVHEAQAFLDITAGPAPLIDDIEDDGSDRETDEADEVEGADEDEADRE